MGSTPVTVQSQPASGESIAAWLKRERMARGLSKATMAALTGYSPSALFQWEAGTLRPLPRNVKALQRFFEENPAPQAAALAEVRA